MLISSGHKSIAGTRFGGFLFGRGPHFAMQRLAVTIGRWIRPMPQNDDALSDRIPGKHPQSPEEATASAAIILAVAKYFTRNSFNSSIRYASSICAPTPLAFKCVTPAKCPCRCARQGF